MPVSEMDEEDTDDSPRYKFKWVNMTLETYLSNMQCRADNLRYEARIIMAKADMIDEERRELESSMLSADET